MACHLVGANQLSEAMLKYCWLEPWEQTEVNCNRNLYISFTKIHFKMSSGKWRPLCFSASMCYYFVMVYWQLNVSVYNRIWLIIYFHESSIFICVSIFGHSYFSLTHCCRVMHIYASISISSDNGLSPGRCQVIIWTDAELLFTGPIETKLN